MTADPTVCTSTGLAVCLLHLKARLLSCLQQEGKTEDPTNQNLTVVLFNPKLPNPGNRPSS